MFNTGKELLKIANEKGLKLWEIVLENEAQVSEIDKKELRNKMKENLVVMKEASTRSLENDIKSISGLIGGDAKKVENYRKNKKTLCGDVINKAMARALSCL